VRAEVEIVKEIGKPVSVTWPDGRKAVLSIDREPVLTLQVPFGLAENTCSTAGTPKCQVDSAFRFVRYAFLWVNHPQPEKVGRVLVKNYGGSENYPLIDSVNVNSVQKYSGFSSGNELPKDRIACEAYDWLPGGTTSAPLNLEVPRWDCEAMSINPETGLMENRIIGGAVNVQLQRDEKGGLEIQKIGAFIGPQPALFQGDIVALVMPVPGQKSFCQMSLKPDLGKVGEVITKYFNDIKEDFIPYVFGSDEYSQYPGPATGSVLSNPDDKDIQ